MNLDVIVLLTGAVIAVPVFKLLGLGSVLGYLAAGALIGPWALGLIDDVDDILHFAELGVVMLLFIIGLELKPARLWALRRSIFGFGSAQLLLSALLIGAFAYLLGHTLQIALLIGLVLALSSTAFALQLLAERGELTQRHGRSAFATLLFQDLAVVPLLALVPLLGDSSSNGFQWQTVALAFGTVVGVVFLGGWVLKNLLKIVARSRVREILTATALLTVLGTATLLEHAGLSMALGAFLAGVLLADTEFRHQLEADIEPFKGLLLGLFFIAVGMSMNLGLIAEQPFDILTMVIALVSIKFLVLFALGKWQGLENASARRLGWVLSQGGEFAFVIFGVAVTTSVLPGSTAELWIVVVSLSMLTTPLLMFLEDRVWNKKAPEEPYELPDDDEPRVIIAGFGRFGQIIARVLSAKKIPFTALDASQEQVDFVKQYGNKIYYGDASRLDLLEAAGADKASLFVLAIDEAEPSLRTAALVSKHFPHLKIYARAHNRKHAYQLMDLGIEIIRRDTFHSALSLTEAVLTGLGYSASRAQHSVEAFKAKDVERLHAHQHLHNDNEKMRDLAKSAARELEEMFAADAASEEESSRKSS
ncbi:MAG: monovalent cation:proton antiporter-2 (CPA2) family protein [Pseudomonadaceae bacterium]|nr:monovalent cation:proton antiporter-2 (CPA2) family protein [Pseudomonadaceae bacterium]